MRDKRTPKDVCGEAIRETYLTDLRLKHSAYHPILGKWLTQEEFDRPSSVTEAGSFITTRLVQCEKNSANESFKFIATSTKSNQPYA